MSIVGLCVVPARTVSFMATDAEQWPEPSVAFVVHEVVTDRGDGTGVWAWCKLQPSGQSGYSEVSYTYDDGVTKCDRPAASKLGAVVVKVWC